MYIVYTASLSTCMLFESVCVTWIVYLWLTLILKKKELNRWNTSLFHAICLLYHKSNKNVLVIRVLTRFVCSLHYTHSYTDKRKCVNWINCCLLSNVCFFRRISNHHLSFVFILKKKRMENIYFLSIWIKQKNLNEKYTLNAS